MDQIRIREAIPTDQNIIYSTWLHGLYGGNDWFSMIPEEIYYPVYRKIIEKILARSTVTIACLEEDPDVILGYAVHEPYTLHWIYVKLDFRKHGIAGKILKDYPIKMASHLTTLGIEIAKSKQIVFNPFFV